MSSRRVVLVHGMWMPGYEMLYVKRHLERVHGFSAQVFSYPSMRGRLDENAELLADFVRSLATEVHLVGHSLGGVLSLRMLALNEDAAVERVVCLGSPLSGSKAARRFSQLNFGRNILGNSVADGVLDGNATDWAEGAAERHEIGTIGGTYAIGIGRLVTTFQGENDGVVAASESRLPGEKDHVDLHVNHLGLVISGQVSAQIAAFLNDGKFSA